MSHEAHFAWQVSELFNAFNRTRVTQQGGDPIFPDNDNLPVSRIGHPDYLRAQFQRRRLQTIFSSFHRFQIRRLSTRRSLAASGTHLPVNPLHPAFIQDDESALPCHVKVLKAAMSNNGAFHFRPAIIELQDSIAFVSDGNDKLLVQRLQSGNPFRKLHRPSFFEHGSGTHQEGDLSCPEDDDAVAPEGHVFEARDVC